MMKSRNILSALMLAAPLAVGAQTPWCHIYSTDESAFISMPLDRIKDTRFNPMGTNFTSVVFEDSQGEQTMDFEVFDKWVIGANVATIYITTDDTPILDISDKTTKYPAHIVVDGAGIYEDIESTPITFRGRGNSTLNYPKKAYNIKFESKTRICDFKKAKSYVLLANWIDGSFMRNYAAFSFGRMIGMPYCNSCRPVDVYLNDNYKGTYTLTQKCGFNNGSVDLKKEDEANSVMIELDTCDPAAGVTMEYGGFTPLLRIPYQLKDPDAPADELEAKEWWIEWAMDFEELEAAVMSGSDISELVDYDTLARYLMVYNLACNQELNHPKSVMLWKTKGGKWQFGPCWDFDWAFGYKQTYQSFEESSDSEARRKHYEELYEKCKKEYGEKYYQFVDSDGTLCWWIDMVPGQFDIYCFNSKGYLVSYMECDSSVPRPSYESPLLATGKNTQSGPFGNGGEFFLAMIENNQEFLDVYAKIWAEVEPKVNDWLKEFDAYSEELKPSANREVLTDTGKHYPTETNAKAVKELKSWIKNRIKYIGNPENNYGLY
ncbi:MAG: CotH kinase family protein [Muribaculaceae bacterium]|nr:CotH kinase family protein [Muribaculaceae bacterium]